ncbi:MAG TPA: DUF1223 domain-containing protein [Hyphomicrobium sp.]|jgi:hypothetical protein|nr:DUF1223 domain-containing protein [Hyphomicrobium sp.]
MRAVPFGLLAAAMAATGLPAAAEPGPRAVVELFTSQGCSSCPPADELFTELAREPDLITLTLPVDYWDRLGWKDTLARHAFTERQEAYAGVRGDDDLFTPQAIINGRESAEGAERDQIERAADATAAGLKVPLSVARKGDNVVLSVGAAAGAPKSPAVVLLLPYYASREVAIGRGENARRKVTYTNVVRDIRIVGDWTGAPVTQAVPAAELKDYDGVVVLLQQGSPQKPGAILGAARAALR